MSNGYRAKWRDDSCREAEVEHFKRLKVAEKFLHFVVQEATVWAEEKEAAIKAGVEPVVALFGSRACGLDAAGNPLPEKTDKPAKPRKPQPYRARVYAPQMVALGTRAALLLLELSPLIVAQWKRLVEAGTDPRRLALDDHDAKVAALLFDEIGVQYHEVMASDQEKLREALDKLEAWVRKLKEAEEANKGGGGPETGPPVASPVAGADSTRGQANFASQKEPDPTPDNGETEPDPDPSRKPAPYSGSGASLDWTKLQGQA